MMQVFTGTQRLARDTLIRALRTNALTPSEDPLHEGSTSTVSRLVRGVDRASGVLVAATEEDSGREDDVIDALAACVAEYWQVSERCTAALHFIREYDLRSTATAAAM